MKNHFVLALFFLESFLLTFLFPLSAFSAPAVPFSDNMVLQRDRPVPIWGRADPGQKVGVTFAGQDKKAIADARGDWSLRLDPLPACEVGRDLVIDDGARRILRNVVVGEIWLCSGQSNMGFSVRQAADGENEVAAAKDSGIRLLSSDLSAGWKVTSPETAGEFSATAFYFACELRKELHVPVGLIALAMGGTEAARWTPRAALQADRSLWEASLPRLWQAYSRNALVARQKAAKQGTPVQAVAGWDEFVAKRMGGLYEKLIERVVPYGIRGVLWYQGEADAGYPDVYAKLFPTLIRSWRSAWGNESLPFLFVQLPNYDTPMAGKWVRLREVQAGTLSLDHAGMAVTIDIGEDGNLHPLNKREVGRRLAILAEASVYGRDVVATGPEYESFSIEPGGIRIRFKKSASPLKLLPPSSGFFIASDDRQFVSAQARIEGNDLIVWSDAVTKPAAVRYAWDAAPKPSLFNGAGLPSAPFRTDNWDYPYEGPRYASSAAEGGKMRIKFVSTGLKLGDKTSRDFQIAGHDRKFVPARVSVDNGDLLVWSEAVPQPEAVRYAWGNDELEISLFDNTGQAALPFRTDAWPEM